MAERNLGRKKSTYRYDDDFMTKDECNDEN